MAHAIICESCGAKIRADRPRCPRCRVRLAAPDPAAVARRSRLLARWSAGLVAGFVVVLAGLWLTRDPAPAAAPAATTARPDPLAARRQPRPAATGTPAPAVESHPFLEPSGAGGVAYEAGDYESALAQFQDAVTKNPQDAESLSNLGQVLVRLGRTEEALPFFARAIAIIPDRWAYRFNNARALALLRRWEESIAEYRRAQQLFPSDYATAFNLALTLHKSGDDASAVDEYKKAIELAPTDASFRLALGISYESLKKPAEAAAAYEEYLRLAPSAQDADNVRAKIAQLTGAPARTTDPSGEAGAPR